MAWDYEAAPDPKIKHGIRGMESCEPDGSKAERAKKRRIDFTRDDHAMIRLECPDGTARPRADIAVNGTVIIAASRERTLHFSRTCQGCNGTANGCHNQRANRYDYARTKQTNSPRKRRSGCGSENNEHQEFQYR